jgi:peptide/nickel transport system substrate-binding protein
VDDLLLGPLGAQRDHSAEALATASPRSRLILIALAAAALLAGCGSGEPSGSPGAGLPPAGGGGTLGYALPALPVNLDPLAADTVSARVVSRQVHEPLVSVVAGPYGGARRRAGLATTLKPSADLTVWSVQLRGGVRFQDGTPFDAAAVLANSRRWASLPAGRRLLPDLFAVDAPRPGEVRFQLDRPVRDLPRLLADPRLGIVSPQALDPPRGEGASFKRESPGSGTGPFRPGSRGRTRLELERNPGWWGSALGLGPALETISFARAPTVAARVGMVRSGEAQVAGPLPARRLAAVAKDPLLSAVPVAGGGVATEASVRGIAPGQRTPLLSGVWLTTLRG